jgi:hypothetical protein
MSRVLRLVLTPLCLVACLEQSSRVTVPDGSASDTSAAARGAERATLSGISCTAAEALHVFPPLAADHGTPATFDATLGEYLRVSRCALEPDGTCGETAELARAEASLQDHRYHLDWRVQPSEIDVAFRIAFALTDPQGAGPPLDLGSVEYTPHAVRVLPMSFRIDHFPLIEAWILYAIEGASATEIAEGLKEFDLDAAGTARNLSCLGFGPTAVGEALKNVGFSPVAIALALQDVFALAVPEVAQVLHDVGFPAADVAFALAHAFGLDAEANARVLVQVGFSLGDAASALETVYALPRNQVDLVMAPLLIETFGPVVFLYPGEAYQMASVDWLLDGSTLLANASGFQQAVTADDLDEQWTAAGCSGAVDCWLAASPPKKPGNLPGATAYVHVYHPSGVADVVDLQFWFFYAYNGPGTMYSRIGNLWDRTSLIAPIGEHWGDWESVTMRFDAALQPTSLFLSQHGSYPGVPVSRFEIAGAFGPSHVKTYASLNGHANYFQPGDNAHRQAHVNLGLGHLDVDLYNRCSSGGPVFATESSYRIVAFDGTIFPGNEWIGFPGNWGPTVQLHMDHGDMAALLWNHFWPGVLSGCAIVSAPCLIFYAACFAACTGGATAGVALASDQIIDALYPGGLLSNGPTSPASKTEWAYCQSPEHPACAP